MSLVHTPKLPRLWSSVTSIQSILAALPADRPSYRGLTTGRLGKSHADGARGLDALRSALFAFISALCTPKPRLHQAAAANKHRVPAFTEEKARPSAPSVSRSLLADPASDPRARAPTRGSGLARSFVPWIWLVDLQKAHAGVVLAPRKAA